MTSDQSKMLTSLENTLHNLMTSSTLLDILGQSALDQQIKEVKKQIAALKREELPSEADMKYPYK